MRDEGSLTRLRDGDAALGSVEAEGRALLRQRERHLPTAAAKARVRVAIESRAGASFAPRWRAAVVAAILTVGVAASSASFGRQWVGAGYHRLLSLLMRAAPPASAPPPPARPVVIAAVSREEIAPPPAEAPAPRRAPRRAPSVALRQDPKSVAKSAPTDDPTSEPTDEPTMVASAMRALRRDHDPTRAGRLLDAYLARWPDGALVEEALALGIEAARARDDARAPTLAAEYLRRFPSGRFVDAARRALTPRAP